MASATIHLHGNDKPSAQVLTIDSNGESFICVDVSDDIGIIMCGRDHAAVQNTRAVAKALNDAADKLAAMLPEEPPVELPPQPLGEEHNPEAVF
jgi:hypothetical protein